MNNSNKGNGLGLCDVLAIVFVILKLVGVIDWSWWWILSPIWIAFIIAITPLVVSVISELIQDKNKKNRSYRIKW